MAKIYKLKKEQLKPIATGHGACMASDRITVEGAPVGYMYREEPFTDGDSGWRFLAGDEDGPYMNDEDKHDVYDVNTIANYDSAIIPHLNAPIDSTFVRADENTFTKLEDDDEDF
jgi:hypothetical protein